MATKKQYTVPINKELCKEFLLKPIPSLTEEHVTEVRKIFNVIIRNYYADMKYDEEELFRENLVKILETRSKYDPSYCAYNYIYTGLRFSIGNERVSRKRVIVADSALPEKEVVVWERKDSEDELLEILSGFYEVKELTPAQVFNLLFLDSEVQEQTAETLVSFVSKVSKSLAPDTEVKVQVISIDGKKIRRILTDGSRLYIVKDLWPGPHPDNVFTYKKFKVPCISETSLFNYCLSRQKYRSLVRKIIRV